MRIVFMGTPDFAVPALRALHAAAHEIVAVYTQPPRPAGRGKKLQPSPIHQLAEELGIPVRHPVSLKGAEEQTAFAALAPDVAVVAAYGLILPQAVLDAPKFGCLNIHASLLPRWRGAAPIHRAILAGDEETGVTIMQMEAGLDTGPMLATVRTPVDDKTTGELTEELAELGAALIVEVLHDLPGFAATPQDHALATYAAKIDKAEARIDWTRPAEEIERLARALAPFPGAWFELANEGGKERVKLLRAEVIASPREGGDLPLISNPEVTEGSPCLRRGSQVGEVLDSDFAIACGSGAIRPVRLQRAGKPALDRADFLRGRPVAAGTRLG
ncbi:MAG: methionyl-tRNA formyltransferase [Erythrobacter sp.]|nr:methionyl-tRNA formyltransferase [Erythrobacter sp.]